MKPHKITETAHGWIIDDKFEIPKKPKPKTRKHTSWFDDFVFDLFNFYN